MADEGAFVRPHVDPDITDEVGRTPGRCGDAWLNVIRVDFTQPCSSAAPGCGGAYGVIAYSTVTNSGPSTIFGDFAVSPGSACTGFDFGIIPSTACSNLGGPGHVTGAINVAN